MERQLAQICALVGDVEPEQLRFVESYVSDRMAVFIPSVGPCFYAITSHHSHPAYSFVLNFDGSCRVVVGDRVVAPAPGTILAMDPDAKHHEQIGDRHSRYLALFIERTFFEEQLLAYPNFAPLPFAFRTYASNPELVNRIKDFMAEADNVHPGREQILTADAMRITHCLIRAMLDLPPTVSEATDRLEVHKVIEYMHLHYEEKLTVKTLAAVAALSPSHFNRVFRRETGASPFDYLITLRLDKVKKLLRSGSTRITEAALSCGFSSHSHLTHCFRKAYGLTPSAYLKSLE